MIEEHPTAEDYRNRAERAERQCEDMLAAVHCRINTHLGFIEGAHEAGVEPSASIYNALVELRALLRDFQTEGFGRD